MKKNIIFSAITAAILSCIGLLINLICSLAFKFAPLSLTIYGGDVKEHVGFGIIFRNIFSISQQNEGNGISTSIHFDLISLLLSFAIIFVIVLIIKNLVSKKKK